MRVRVLLFGVLKDLFPSGGQTLDLPPGSTVETVLDHYREIAPAQQGLWPSLAIAVNQRYAPHAYALEEGDEVALLPPVSGGSGESSGGGDDGACSSQFASGKVDAGKIAKIALVREPVDARAIVAEIKQGADGAVVVFDGIVRDNTRGRRTLYLMYEAYEAMALRLMQSLAREAAATRGVREVAIVHRLGRLETGETSVLIAVSSAHRAQAFDACRWLIDTLKKTVPIWKREYFEDGAVWADGEPFPSEIAGKETA